MNAGRTSPKRRHILSSINPEDPSQPAPRERRTERRHRSHTPPSEPEEKSAAENGKHEHDAGDTTRPRASRLKLKSKDSRSSRHHHSSRRRHRSRDRHDDKHTAHKDSADDKDDGLHTRSSRHRRHRRRRSRSPTPPDPHQPAPLDAEAAFRESLFDAMADDEGAAYWEGVYGQPVHVYEQDKVGPQGELERMTEDEYAAHVRQKMWEKTHQGLLEERARREERRRQKEQEKKQNKQLHEEMERSLRRGEQRRERRRWARTWEDYSAAWEHWDGAVGNMYWPWDGGKAKRAAGWGIVEDGEEEVVKEEVVRGFFVHGLAAEEIGAEAFAARLRDERVRWHPDKMQQRLGGKVEEKVMRDVTAIFQIIDRLWTDMQKKSKA